MPKQGIEGMWNRITLYCMNHEEPSPMIVIQNLELVKTPFYACRNDEGKPICANRMNLDDYQDMILQFMDYVAEHPYENLTNYSFPYKGRRHSYRVKVLRYTPDQIDIGVKNRTILGGK